MTPPDSFVPLTAAAAPATPREFRVSILNGHAPVAGNGDVHSSFHSNGNGNGNGNGHSNGSGDGTVKSDGFQSLASQRPGLMQAGGGEKKIGEPRVTVQRDGDRVTHVRIQCTCGQIMDLACVYDPPAPAK
jgi:hypothetical protein